jgi:arsenate reductase
VSLLKEHNLDFSIVEYIKTPLTHSEIISLSNKLGKTPGEFVRKNEADFKNNNLAKQLDDDQKMAEAIAKFPKIMERPIAVKGDRAVIGRPPENVLSLLRK